MTEPESALRAGDWVQLPVVPARPQFSYRLGKVIDLEDDIALVSVIGAGELRIAADRVKKITWATPYEPPIPHPAAPPGANLFLQMRGAGWPTPRNMQDVPSRGVRDRVVQFLRQCWNSVLRRKWPW